MSNPKITNFISPISSDDTYPTHKSIFGHGGFKSVGNIGERDAIPSGRLEIGNWVNVTGDNVYEWDGSTWSIVSGLAGESFTGVIVDGTTITGDGVNNPLGVGSVNVNFGYYYGKTQNGFIPTGVDTFFADSNFIEEDPFSFSDNVGSLTIPTTARYLVDVEGSMSNNVSGTILELRKNASPIARTKITDLGNDDIAQFGLTYEGQLSATDIIQVRKDNSSAIYNDCMIRVRELVDNITVLAGTSGAPITALDEGITLSTDISSIDFVGSGISATNLGGAVTINVPSIPPAASVDLHYYYGKTQAGFVPTSGSTFFSDSNFVEDDMFSLSDNSSTITIAQSGRYSIDVGGSLDNAVNSGVIELRVDGSPVARTTMQDLGGDDTAQFGLTYEGNLSSGNIVDLNKTDTTAIYTDVMFRLRQEHLISNFFGSITGGSENIANTDLNFDGNRSHELSGNDLTISNSSPSDSSNIIINSSGYLGLSLQPTQQTLGDTFGTNAYFSVFPMGGSSQLKTTVFSLAPLGTEPELRLYNTISQYIGFKANTVHDYTTYTLPSGDGSIGQVLTTDGSGDLSWAETALTNTNFAESDLTFDGARTHDLNDNTLTLLNSPNIAFFASGSNGLVLQPTLQRLGIGGQARIEINGDDNSTKLYGGVTEILTESGIQITDIGSAFYVGFDTPSLGTNTTYTLPSGDGSIGQTLTTDGGGTLYWDDAISGSDTNFAKNDLTLDGARTHDLNGNSLIINNASNGRGLWLTNTSQILGEITGATNLTVSPAVSNIELAAYNTELRRNDNTQPNQLRFYDSGNNNYVGFQCIPTYLNSDIIWTLPTGDGTSGQQLTTDGGGNLSWADEFDTSESHDFGIQQHIWTAVTTEAVIDLTGVSPSQTTTLTTDRLLDFAGTPPANRDRTYYLEVTHTGDVLTISGVNDPGASFAQPSYSPYIIGLKLTSAGVPRFAGVI